MRQKDKKIIEDSERDGIPIFVLTAKDVCSIGALVEYYKRCHRQGCTKQHCDGVANRIGEFRDWQLRNTHKVKNPD